MKHVNLIAASYKEGYPIIGTRHNAYTLEDKKIVQDALDLSGQGYYYPTDLGKALLEAGIASTIQAHSGRLVINGKYENIKAVHVSGEADHFKLEWIN